MRDVVAGAVASILLIANIVSFGALMFPSELSAGVPTVIWAMLIGSCLGGLCIAATTSLPPLATGVESPTGAVLILLGATAASGVVAAGGKPEVAVQLAMLAFLAMTVVSGLLIFALGYLRLGSYFRFLPSFVVTGFLAATGWFLIAGGLKMTLGRMPGFGGAASTWVLADLAKLAAAIGVLALLLGLRRWTKWPFALPVALVVMWLLGVSSLRLLGISGQGHGWYLPSLGTLVGWSPLTVIGRANLSWSTIAGLVPELLDATVVALLSLITKVSSLEQARQTAGDLDCEFRAHGMGSLLAAPFGGIVGGMQTGTSRLLEQTGGATCLSGVVSSLLLGLVALANIDLPGIIPIPIVAGLVFNLGTTFLLDALWCPFVQRAWTELSLIVGLMIVCVSRGFLAGVVVGLLCACVLFAINYARVGAVRRHLSRAQFASNVERSRVATTHLRAHGDAIQVYWLSGYVFFGSSEGVFERIRGDIEALADRTVAYVVVDFGMMSGADTSALLSLAKLRNYCAQRGTTLVYAALTPANRAGLERAGLFAGKTPQQSFVDANDALAWCEDRLLAKAGLTAETDLASFEPWLQTQLGADARVADLMSYVGRRDFASAQIVYRAGDAADTVDLAAVGSLTIELPKADGTSLRLRRFTTHTVIGEMGFFRRAVRSANVTTDGLATVFTLTRTNYERMQRSQPDLARAFQDFIIRTLADRIEASERGAAALNQ